MSSSFLLLLAPGRIFQVSQQGVLCVVWRSFLGSYLVCSKGLWCFPFIAEQDFVLHCDLSVLIISCLFLSICYSLLDKYFSISIFLGLLYVRDFTFSA